MMAAGRIRAVVVFSDSPRELADWYRSVFVAREVTTSPDFIGLHLGAFTLFVQRTSEGHEPGMGGVRPHFTVLDCEQAYEELLRAGASTVLPPTDLGAEVVAAVRDPHGNPIGLLQVKEGSA